MDKYREYKEAVLELGEKTSGVISEAEAVVDNEVSPFDPWKQTCANIQQNLMEHIMRIAVVGAIKSGKSTLVNALLQDDYLKRGAGVVTSIVTRIRRGGKLRARLYFKSWDEVNDDIEQALVLFPSDEWKTRSKGFDIRRSGDRSALADALDALDGELKLARDSLNANSVLLSSYLKGFDEVQKFVQAESSTRDFQADDFGSHRNFVGDDSLAVYLKDIQLEIISETLEASIEMADCQGSDSPNPLHMAMIQDYLLKAHLVVYVISSRTGLRQADIRFLNIIKQMGIADNMLFVCNCDFNEHESLEDLEGLVRRIKDELCAVISEPQLFVFSSLYHLFVARKDHLTSRDKARLKQWVQLKDLTAVSNSDIERLKTTLSRKLTRERSALLLQNQIERLDVVQTGLLNYIQLHSNLLKRNAEDARSMGERLHGHQGYMVQVQTMIQGALKGSIQNISSELKKEIDRFFDPRKGPVLQKIVGFIRNYNVDLEKYRQEANSAGFNQALYLVFQEFKQAVNALMAEQINPEIMAFIGQLEQKLQSYFHSVVDPFEAMVRDAIRQYEEALVQFELTQMPGRRTFDTTADIDAIKQSMGLDLPPAAATMRYSAHIKTDAVMRLGVFSLLRVARKVFKKEIGAEGEQAVQALKGGIRRMKRETERSIYENFRDHQENIKFQYILRLADATSKRLYEDLTEQFRIYVSDLKGLISSMSSEHRDKEKVDAQLKTLENDIRSIHSRIGNLRRDIGQLRDGEDSSGELKVAATART